MREPNLGTTLFCNHCGKSYWSEDGWPFCSGACEEAAENLIKEEKLGELESDLENLITDYEDEDINEDEFKAEWNRLIYHAEEDDELDPDDVVADLIAEYNLICLKQES